MIVTQGKGVSKGVIKGKLYFYQHPDNTITKRTAAGQKGEKFRLTEAQQNSIQRLNELSVSPSMVLPLWAEIRESVAETCALVKLED